VKHIQRNNSNRQSRRGALLPAIAFSLLVVAAASALVMNKLWIDAAEVELQSTAEASALAAAGRYLSDDLLRPNADIELIIQNAKQQAADVTAMNVVGGKPIQLTTTGDDTDVVFGQRVQTGAFEDSVFLLTHDNPNVVEVRARRGRDTGNPINLFFPGVTGLSDVDAAMIVEVAFDNLIDHFAATEVRPVPAFPLAILTTDAEGKREDTWEHAIVNRKGPDEYGYDETTQTIVKKADGIPELRLKSSALDENEEEPIAPIQLLDFGNELNEAAVIAQIHAGLSVDALTTFKNRLPAHVDIDFTGLSQVPTPTQLAFEQEIGQQRLCLLYHQGEKLSTPGWTSLVCRGFVAIRILAVIPEAGETCTIVVQPTVMTTRSAVLAKFYDMNRDLTPNLQPFDYLPVEQQITPNPYVYKMYVNR